jgi:carbamoyltransferase
VDILGISGFDNGIRFKRSRFPNLERRRYRIVQGLDSAAVLVRDGAVAFAVAEERLTRDKGTGAFPQRAIEACLAGARLDPDRIDCVAHCFDYGPFRDLFGMDPDLWDWWSGVYDPQRQARLLELHFPGVDWGRRLVAVPHHLAHAASAFYPSGFQEALVMVSDGMGELDSLTIYAAEGKRFEPLASISAFHSLGILYGVFTLYLGFAFGMDEYQVMGLAPYPDLADWGMRKL